MNSVDARATDERAVHATALVALLLLVICGFAFRAYGIGHLEFFYDEAALWHYGLTGSTLYTPTEPPLMAWILFGVMSLEQSASAFLFHIVPVVLGTAGIVAAFVFTRALTGSTFAGMTAAALMTVSPMAIHYAQEGRPYALLMLSSTCVYWAFLKAWGSRRISVWLMYALFVFLCCLSHLLAVQVVTALTILAVLFAFVPAPDAGGQGGRLSSLVTFVLVTGCAGLAGLLWFVQRYFTDPAIHANEASILESGIYPFGIPAFLRESFVNLGAGPFGPRQGFVAIGLADLLGAALLALFLLGLWRVGRRRGAAVAVLPAMAVACPLLIDYLTLGEKGKWDWMRYMSHALVPYLAGVSSGVEALLATQPNRSVRTVAAAALTFTLVPFAVQARERPDYQRYRNMAGYLAENAADLSGVLVLPARPQIVSPADERISDIYYYQKRETLPVFLLDRGRIRKSVLVPTRRSLALLSQPSPDVEGLPESGKYAVLSQNPFRDCSKLSEWVKDGSVAVHDSKPIMDGLTICALEANDPLRTSLNYVPGDSHD